MLKALVEYLGRFADIPGAGMFGYLSFRSAGAIILALILGMIFGGKVIKWLKNKQIGEDIRELGLEGQSEKKGTPTMGGVIILAAILIPSLLLGRLDNIYMILMLVTTVWLGGLGFADDYIKTFKKNKDGIPGKVKIAAQVGLGLVIGLTLYLSPQAVMRENIVIEKANHTEEVQHRAKSEKINKTTIPFVKEHNLDYSEVMSFCGDYKEEAGWVLFVVITVLAVTAVSNGANLNDGMDGMLAGNGAIMGVTLAASLCVEPHQLGRIPEHYVLARSRGGGDIHFCLHWCAHWFLMVQRLPGAGVYGRHRQSHHWRYNCRYCHSHTQGDFVGDFVRCVRCRKSLGDGAGCIL